MPCQKGGGLTTTSSPHFSVLSRATANSPWILEIIYNASEEGQTTRASVSSIITELTSIAVTLQKSC